MLQNGPASPHLRAANQLRAAVLQVTAGGGHKTILQMPVGNAACTKFGGHAKLLKGSHQSLTDLTVGLGHRRTEEPGPSGVRADERISEILQVKNGASSSWSANHLNPFGLNLFDLTKGALTFAQLEQAFKAGFERAFAIQLDLASLTEQEQAFVDRKIHPKLAFATDCV